MLFGRFGWFSRYEIYAIAFDLMVLVYVVGPALGRLLDGAEPARVLIVALCPMAFLSAYPQTTAATSLAARNVYEQHYQMHRFVASRTVARSASTISAGCRMVARATCSISGASGRKPRASFA